MEHKDSLLGRFGERFGGSLADCRCFFAPGRINLIGEHIDYCGGPVLPASIQFGTYAVVRHAESDEVQLESTRFEARGHGAHFSLSQLRGGGAGELRSGFEGWGRYPMGVLAGYLERGAEIGGMQVLFHGDLPGAGLSSSASIEICTALAVESLSGFRLAAAAEENRRQMALLCQRVENDFVGVRCGIMDQATVALAHRGFALLLDCREVSARQIPLSLEGIAVVIADTRKPRRLVESAYNRRRDEVEEALVRLQGELPIASLCELEPGESLARALDLLSDPVLCRRVRHVVSEVQRVGDARVALEGCDWLRFGELLLEGHRSLQHDYEVSCEELDCIVDTSIGLQGVYGARMTGAGFGGCAVLWVDADRLDTICTELDRGYREKLGSSPGLYRAELGFEAEEL